MMSPETRMTLERLWPRYLHIPYKWGGDHPGIGLDCSGLVLLILQSVGAIGRGIDLTAQGLYARWPKLTEPGPAFGDLCFFGKSSEAVTHVGFCLGPNLMLEAGGGGPTTTTPEIAIKQHAMVRVSPIKGRKDLVGYRRPDYP